MRSLSIVLLCLPFSHLQAQQFEDVTNQWQINHTYQGNNYGSGVTVYDWNKDGRDDIVFCRVNQTPLFYENTESGFVNILSPLPAFGEAKQLSFADYDNDGDPDIFVTVYNSHPRLFKNEGNFYFTESTFQAGIPLQMALSFGHSWADVDMDGDLDVHVCNYNGPGFPNPSFKNYLLKNNGNGTFTDMGTVLSGNDLSHYTLASVFSDYNRDFVPDLFVANDRFSARNYLYRGTGGGQFQETAEEAGVNQFILSMCATIGDVQNDGYPDIYVTNTTDGNLLHINNGNGTFTQSASSMGVAINEFCWGSLLLDFDNDSWSDLFANSSPHITFPGRNHFFKNNAGAGFEDISTAAGFTDSGWYNHSASAGDFDNDGRYDIVFTRQSPANSRVMRNTTQNNNNFIKVTLEGVTSNRDGIGTWISAYASGSSIHCYTTLGDGYLSQNSQHKILGLGDATIVDSLVIVWPGGFTDKYFNLPVNLRYHVVEGFHLTAQIELSQTDNVLCQGETMTLTAQPSEMVYLWSTGELTQSINVSQPGAYSVQVFHPSSFTSIASIEIAVVGNPVFSTEVTHITCAGMVDGTAAVLPDSDELLIEWMDGATDWYRDNLTAGSHDFTVSNEAGCTTSGSVQIAEPLPLTFDFSISSNDDSGDCPYTWKGEIMNLEGGMEPYTVKWFFDHLNSEGQIIASDSLVNIHNWDCKPGPMDIRLVLADNNGCGQTLEQNADELIGISEEGTASVRVYPNPCDDVCIIESDRLIMGWEIFNAQGKCVCQERINPVSKSSLHLSELNAGFYWVRIISSSGEKLPLALVISQ